MHWLSDPNAWLGLLTLTLLEIVLGVDNIIFISILSSKLPADKQAKARRIGLAGAFCTRVLLLLSIAWISKLTAPLFTIAGFDVSGRALILVFGGLFLIAKATFEIHGKLEGGHDPNEPKARQSLVAVIAQIAVIDIVFSLDSVITAVGMTDQVVIMITANVLALVFMLAASGPVARFVDEHPTVKMLALAFLVLIGTNLVAEGFGQHIPKGYTYFAMAFSVFVEMLNLRLRRRAEPAIKLRGRPSQPGAGEGEAARGT
jgi:predicted tellurium resistance membrane protein TerC